MVTISLFISVLDILSFPTVHGVLCSVNGIIAKVDHLNYRVWEKVVEGLGILRTSSSQAIERRPLPEPVAPEKVLLAAFTLIMERGRMEWNGEENRNCVSTSDGDTTVHKILKNREHLANSS